MSLPPWSCLLPLPLPLLLFLQFLCVRPWSPSTSSRMAPCFVVTSASLNLPLMGLFMLLDLLRILESSTDVSVRAVPLCSSAWEIPPVLFAKNMCCLFLKFFENAKNKWINKVPSFFHPHKTSLPLVVLSKLELKIKNCSFIIIIYFSVVLSHFIFFLSLSLWTSLSFWVEKKDVATTHPLDIEV